MKERKNYHSKFAIVLIFLLVIILLFSFYANNSFAADTTGNQATISKAPDSQKIGSFHTYRK